MNPKGSFPRMEHGRYDTAKETQLLNVLMKLSPMRLSAFQRGDWKHRAA
jgi:hypothetical protein